MGESQRGRGGGEECVRCPLVFCFPIRGSTFCRAMAGRVVGERTVRKRESLRQEKPVRDVAPFTSMERWQSRPIRTVNWAFFSLLPLPLLVL